MDESRDDLIQKIREAEPKLVGIRTSSGAVAMWLWDEVVAARKERDVALARVAELEAAAKAVIEGEGELSVREMGAAVARLRKVMRQRAGVTP